MCVTTGGSAVVAIKGDEYPSRSWDFGNLRVTPSRSELIGDRICPLEAPRREGRHSTDLSVFLECGFRHLDVAPSRSKLRYIVAIGVRVSSIV